jgi:hypothetical protein
VPQGSGALQGHVHDIFFAGKLTKYFPVDVDATTTANPNIEELIKMAKQKDRERNAARDIVDTEQHKVDKTPWLRRTEWPQMFSGVGKN